jgi:hypothetical protein
MTLEQTSYVSQIIAAIAVVGSLIYLGLQVRHAERSQRGMMQQGRADRVSAAVMTFADPDRALLWQKGMAGDAGFTPLEFIQWMMLFRAMLLSGEDSFLQHNAGLLTEDTFETFVTGVRHYMANPGFRASWRLSRNQFGAGFRDFMDTIANETPAAHGADTFSEWKELVHAEMNAVVS